jgi:hypothetical protein
MASDNQVMREGVRRVLLLTAALVCFLAVLASSEQGHGQKGKGHGGGGGGGGQTFNVTTHHYDTLRTGWNNEETILTPANVGSPKFGLIATATLDEQVDAQPLVMLNQNITGQPGTHTVVYIATANNTIYAIDGTNGGILLSRNLGSPVPNSVSGCTNNSNVIGISSTPVIDTSTGILYVIAYTLVNSAPTFSLHALHLSNLQDAITPIVVTASVTLSNGTTQYTFNPNVSRQRSALLLESGNVYAGFASFCDFNPGTSRGWLLGWNATTLLPLPNEWLTDRSASSPSSYFLSSVWMSGSGPASDGTGIFFLTGNSDPSGNTLNVPGNLTESAVYLSMDLTTLKSYFTPDNYPQLDSGDTDFGGGGIMLLPPQASGPALATAMGKDGGLYLLNRAALGGYNTSTNAVLYAKGTGFNCWCAESYFTGSDSINRVVASSGQQLQTFKVQTEPSPTLVADSWSQQITSGQDGGFFTTVSSNGSTNGIIWAVGRPDGSNNFAVYLDAFDANSGFPLVQNMIAGHWPNTPSNANLVPVVTNGQVYVASYKQLAIFGITTKKIALQPIAAPQAALPRGVSQVTGTIKSASGPTLVLSTRLGTEVTVNITDAVQSQRMAASGNALTVIGSFHADGTLFAQSITRAKSSPALWPPDR